MKSIIHLFIYCFFLSGFTFIYGQNTEGLSVTLKKGQTVRDLAKEYLNDANLWNEILKFNGFRKITDVKPGMLLKIPSAVITSANRELDNAKKKIQEATSLGAKLFAPALIADAIKKREAAQEKRKSKDWNDAEQLALASIDLAQKAIEESRKKNNIQVQAVLSQKLGNVQGRGNTDLTWEDTPLKSQLAEGQKVRTLSQSFAEISFKDASKLVMNANSQAIIQKMRVNVLENKQESKVSLVEGDIYALLSGNKKKKISVDINGVEAKINADRFWFNKTGNNLKVASYGGSIEFTQNGKTVIIGENKGTIIGTNSAANEESDLLAAPALKSPLQNMTVFKSDKKNEITFQWEPIQGAQRYWLEIANDNSSFSDLIFSQDNIGLNEFKIFDVKHDGVYYWRITPINKDGFPGQRSLPRVFKVITDNAAPYLSIHTPAPGDIIKEKNIVIRGETENFVELFLDGKKIPIDTTGKFETSYQLHPGSNKLTFSMTDPAANTDTVTRIFYYAPPKKPKFNYAANLAIAGGNKFITNVTTFSLNGTTDSLSTVSVYNESNIKIGTTLSDSLTGKFHILVPASEGENSYKVYVSTRLRDTLSTNFSVICDTTPPDIAFLESLPTVMRSDNVKLSLKLNDISKLYINGDEIAVKGGSFQTQIKLQQGVNKINIVGMDLAGNKTMIERVILYDNYFPEKVTQSYQPQVAVGGEAFVVNVNVDRLPFEISRTAVYEYEVGGKQYSGLLRYSESTGKFSDYFSFPKDFTGKVRVTKIIFENSLGATKDFEFN